MASIWTDPSTWWHIPPVPWCAASSKSPRRMPTSRQVRLPGLGRRRKRQLPAPAECRRPVIFRHARRLRTTRYRDQMSWTLFVEGKWDEAFVLWLLRCLRINEDVRVRRIGGGVSYLRHVANEIRKEHDGGQRVALLLDADSDARDRRDELKTEIARLDLPIAKSFLLSDDGRGGDLETLLEQMVPSTHQAVCGCFDKYEECLTQSRTGVPDSEPQAAGLCILSSGRCGDLGEQELRRSGKLECDRAGIGATTAVPSRFGRLNPRCRGSENPDSTNVGLRRPRQPVSPPPAASRCAVD